MEEKRTGFRLIIKNKILIIIMEHIKNYFKRHYVFATFEKVHEILFLHKILNDENIKTVFPLEHELYIKRKTVINQQNIDNLKEETGITQKHVFKDCLEKYVVLNKHVYYKDSYIHGIRENNEEEEEDKQREEEKEIEKYLRIQKETDKHITEEIDYFKGLQNN